jgi:hypothetical protein
MTAAMRGHNANHSTRHNGSGQTNRVLNYTRPSIFSAGWDALDDQLAWILEKRGNSGGGYSFRQGEPSWVAEEFSAWVRAAPGMDVRIVREGGHNRMGRKYLLAERINAAPLTSFSVRSAEADALRMAAVKLYDPPLLIAGTVDEEFAARLIVSEREDLCSRRCSILAGAGAPLRVGTVMSRTRTERVADEMAIKVACLTQAACVGPAISGDPDSDRELADQVEYRYFPTPRGAVANGGILLNAADNFAPEPEQHYGAIVLRGDAHSFTQARFEHLVFDDTIDTAEERERVADSLSQGAGVFVRMHAA